MNLTILANILRQACNVLIFLGYIAVGAFIGAVVGAIGGTVGGAEAAIQGTLTCTAFCVLVSAALAVRRCWLR